MSRTRTSLVLFLITLVALNQTSAEYEKKAHKKKFGMTSLLLPKKSKELTKLCCLKARQEQHLEENYAVLFKFTLSLEMGLYCLALLVGVVHLRCWEWICKRRKKKLQPAYVELYWDEEIM